MTGLERIEYPDENGAVYWMLHTWRDGDRTWYEIRYEGWVVATWIVKGDRAHCALKPQQEIPAKVLADLCPAIRALTK